MSLTSCAAETSSESLQLPGETPNRTDPSPDKHTSWRLGLVLSRCVLFSVLTFLSVYIKSCAIIPPGCLDSAWSWEAAVAHSGWPRTTADGIFRLATIVSARFILETIR